MSNENSTTKEKNIEEKKNPFKEYAEHSSVEGVHKVLSAHSLVRRLAWLVVLIVCVTGVGYALRNNFIKIANRPTSTTISTTTPSTLEFPAVTICNLNIFSAQKALSTLPEAIADLQRVFDGDNHTCYNLLGSYINLESTDFLDLIKTNPQDLITKCRFAGEECDIAVDFEPILTHLGVCFTFNSGKNGKPIRKVSNAGVRNGLQLHLNVDQSDYIATFAGDAGVKIAVHPQSEPPLPDEFGIAVPPGNNAFISFTKRTVEDEAKINCKEEEDTGDWNFLATNYSYSQAACLVDSFHTRVADNCRCIVTNVFYPQPSKPPYKSQLVCNFADICCNFEQYTKPIKTPCVPACSFEEYPIATASYSLFPASYRSAEPSLSGDVASANIFFQTLTVENQHTEFAYGIEEFFAELGGHLELFIGANIIGLFEFLFFLYDAVKFCVVRKLIRKTSKSVELTEFPSDDDVILES